MHIVFNFTFKETSPGGSSTQLQRIEESLTALHGKVGLMATKQSIEALIAEFDAATNRVAAKIEAHTAEIQRLKDQIAQGSPISQADLDALAGSLQSEVDQLKALGADPNNPVPNPGTDNPPVPVDE